MMCEEKGAGGMFRIGLKHISISALGMFLSQDYVIIIISVDYFLNSMPAQIKITTLNACYLPVTTPYTDP